MSKQKRNEPDYEDYHLPDLHDYVCIYAGPTLRAAGPPKQGILIMGSHVATANVKCKPLMPQNFVEEDIHDVADIASVVLWQEIVPKRYKDAVLGLGAAWDHVYLAKDTPISWRKNIWEYVDQGKHQAVAPKKGITNGRYIVWVDLRHKKSGKVVRFTNSHFISKAFHHRFVMFKKWRRQAWMNHYHAYMILCTKWKDEGLTVIGGGDYNRTDCPKFIPEQTWMTNGKGIDYLWVLGPSAKFIRTVDVFYHQHSDHEPRVSLFQMGWH